MVKFSPVLFYRCHTENASGENCGSTVTAKMDRPAVKQGILATFHPYLGLVEGTITTWGTPYRVITLSQRNTWIIEPILKFTCVTKVGNSGNIHFSAHYKIFHT